MTRPLRTIAERVAATEVLSDFIRRDISDLKDSVKELDDTVNGLSKSQDVQLVQLRSLLESVAKLQATTTNITGQLANKILEKELVEVEKGFDKAKLKKIAASLAGVVFVIYSAYMGACELIKPNDSLVERHGHTEASK